MAKVWSIVHAIGAVVFIVNSVSIRVLADEQWLRKYEQAVDAVSAMVDWNATDIPGYECWERKEAGIPPLGKELVFPCDVHLPSEIVPTSAHRVRFADVQVVAAMGDSISAGNGADACTLPELVFMARGRIYSHGGDDGFKTNPTLANILMKYNPELKGYGVDRGNWDSEEAGLNVAYPGDKARDMPHQAEWLVQKMKADRSIDYESDWKVVTLFIGGNDLCDWCVDTERYSAENYVKHISEALMILHDNMPRTIVNVVNIIQVYQVDLLRAPICNVFHVIFCSCGMFLTEDELARFEAINKEYQVKLEEDIMSGRYDDKDDFTVVLQPFLEETGAPFIAPGEPDFSYFAPDCFHFSAKGHAQLGLELWNNMMEPVGGKKKEWTPGVTTVSCPPEEFPYIYTNLNSRAEFWDLTPAPIGSRAPATTSFLFSTLIVCLATAYVFLQNE